MLLSIYTSISNETIIFREDDNELTYYFYYVRKGCLGIYFNKENQICEGYVFILSDISSAKITVNNADYFIIKIKSSKPIFGIDFLNHGGILLDLSNIKQFIDAILIQLLLEGQETSISTELSDSLLECLLSYCYKQIKYESSDENEFIDIVKEYIENNFKKEITLSELSNLVNVSMYHLSHLFKTIVGDPPIKYVINCRIMYAKKLLVKTSLSIDAIASEVGYFNTNYFNILFKKNVGMSPGKFRKLNINSSDEIKEN
jgi:YesN/AraC family two-component response regulator